MFYFHLINVFIFLCVCGGVLFKLAISVSMYRLLKSKVITFFLQEYDNYC